MKTDYHERREARIDRLRDRADKHKAEGESKMESGRKMLHAIPFGQPILVGHHSERRTGTTGTGQGAGWIGEWSKSSMREN